MKPARFISALTSLVATLGDEDLVRLVQMIRSGKIQTDSPTTTVEDTLGIHGSTLQSVISLLRSWEGTRSALAASVMAALKTRQRLLRVADSVGLVWTGPVQFTIPARTTLATTKEMVSNAKNSVTVVGYRVTYGARPVFEELAKKHRDGIVVRVILDSAAEQFGVLSRLWPKGQEFPELYENRTEGSLHAKLTLVDGHDMLITSANLTHHGLRSNIEIGARIQGRVAGQVESLINKLIRDRHLVRILPSFDK